MILITFTWRDAAVDLDDHVWIARWPSVPRLGDHVTVNDETGEGYMVKLALWNADGTVVVRLGV